MKIIVTGGAGFIGSHTVIELTNNGFEAIIVDDFRNSKPFVIDRIEKITNIRPKNYCIDCCDFKELENVIKTEKPEGIIHFAAYKAVGESVKKPLEYYDNNLNSLINLLKLSSKYKIKNFVFSSSCTVYGNAKIIPVTENTPIQKAVSPYGNTKQIGEDILHDYFSSNKHLNITILRYFNPIGAHPSGLIGELPLGTPNNLIPFITQTAIGIRKELTIFGNDYPTIDGSCIRDYIHVVDLANAHIKALKKQIKQKPTMSIYNVGTGNGTSVFEIVKCFESTTGTKLNYKIGEKREGDVTEIFADNSKIVTELNWKPKYSLEEALNNAWNWEKNLQHD